MGRKSDSRQRLMDAAHQLIQEYSYGAVTIEAICERAGVKKGSFYYFFESKSDLAVAAITAWRDERAASLANLFRPEAPAIERIWKYLDFVTRRQLDDFGVNGQILGCPLFTLGSEICTQDDRITVLIQDILATGVRFFEEAVLEAHAAGDLNTTNPAVTARLLWAFYEGTLTRARIENNPDLIRNMSSDALELIGARTQLAIVA
ncbi:MAG TPA: TetR/AcrR family transcriptional regulator [Candidatus Methylacidiphilales bacterium]